jgi:NADPH-dependent ferric siderophore reductase
MKEFVAQARIALADPETVIAPFCEHMVEHGASVEACNGEHVVRFANSRARFSHEADVMRIDATAASLEELYFIRLTVASHIVEFAGAQTPEISWTGDGGDFVRPPNFQILRIVGVRNVTPHMRRITFSGADIDRLTNMSALHLNILVQHPDLTEPQWPSVGANGLVRWQDPERRPSFRKYTVRSFDLPAGTIDIDFVIHADAGPGSTFAEHAKAGDQVGIVGPGGGGLVDAEWYLFAGDETALPAIGRMLENLPENARGKALIEVADESEIQPLSFKAGIEVEWLCRNGATAGTTQLLADAVRRTAFPADGTSVYAWAGCEFEAFRAIRAYLRKERGLSKQENLIVSYWRRGKSEDDAGKAADSEDA